MRFLFGLSTVSILWLLVAGDGGGALARMRRLKEKRAENIRNQFNRNSLEAAAAPILKKRSSPFLNSQSKQFAVDGSNLPDVDWDVGESYAGLLPISDNPDETRQLYFWFFPSTNPAAEKEITIWLQGGPGAASTAGLMLENGPILYQPGTVKPRQNTFSWTNLTNMVWIDQPVGTGFSVGTPNITNEYQMADQFMGFWKNFVDTFSMQGYKVYLTGESYSGYYVPYIANGFIEAKDDKYFNFQGAAINDPIIGNEIIQFEGVAMQYLNTWAQAFGLDSATMANLTAQNHKCGYDTYLEKYFK
jgi:carboxypeptidase D